MSEDKGFEDLDREERVRLCREVMDSLSDLVEGTAPADFCARVETLLGSCQPYRAYRDTLQATLRLLKECGARGDRLPPEAEACYRRAVARAREALSRRDDEENA